MGDDHLGWEWEQVSDAIELVCDLVQLWREQDSRHCDQQTNSAAERD